jgi:hypothetical protein
MGKGDDTLRYLYGSWGEERQMATEKLDPGVRQIGSHTGRSTNGFAPWQFLVLRKELHLLYYQGEDHQAHGLALYAARWQRRYSDRERQ